MTNTTVVNITRLIFHGAVHTIRYEPGNSTAEVTFLKGTDCKKYLDATANGIPWPEEQDRVIVTEPCDAENGSMEHFALVIQNNFTRCIRVIGLESDWKTMALKRLADGKKKDDGKYDRTVERMINGHDSSKRRIVDFRFCKIADAITFKAEMERDKVFEDGVTVTYTTDPCATATGVHNGLM